MKNFSFLVISILIFSGFTLIKSAHLDEGELLCFTATNYDAGEIYLNEKSRPFFVFMNCSHDTVEIESLQCNNPKGEQPYYTNYRWLEKRYAPGAIDTLFFNRGWRNSTLAGLL